MTVKDEHGKIVNLEGTTVTATINHQDEIGTNKEVIVTDAIAGKCQFFINKEDIMKQGLYHYRVTVSSPRKTFPSIKNKFQVVN